MAISKFRVLLVDDFEPWRSFSKRTLQEQSGLQVVGEASDGLEAIQKAQKLQPDLILLDISLPTLNGIEAARRIREVSPASKILFVSDNRSAEIAAEALSTGAGGYVVKSQAASELWPALEAVLQGKQFVSANLTDSASGDAEIKRIAEDHHRKRLGLPLVSRVETRHHEVGFYSDDASLLNGFTHFIEAALKAGSAVIVVATEVHRGSLLQRLQANGLDMGTTIEQGRYISLDAAETLSTLMTNDRPDPVRFEKVVGDLVMAAAKAAIGTRPHVAACGECAPLLWSQGNVDAAIRVEHLWDEIARRYDVDILCGYPLGGLQGEMGSHMFGKICAEHSAVHSR